MKDESLSSDERYSLSLAFAIREYGSEVVSPEEDEYEEFADIRENYRRRADEGFILLSHLRVEYGGEDSVTELFNMLQRRFDLPIELERRGY